MWIWLAALAWFGSPPEPSSSGDADPVASAAVRDPASRRRAFGRMPSWFGPAIATGLGARHYGDPERPPTRGQLAAATIVGGLQGRLAGYAERRTRSARAELMLTPELMLNLELGGTTAWRDAIAEQRGLATRQGAAFGVSGLAVIGVAWASPGLAGVYARINIGQRFSARTNDTLAGPHLIASLASSAGLRIAVRRELTLLVGGGIEGSAGVQRFDDRGRLIAQLAPIAELGLYTQPRPDLYFGWIARGDVTVLGQRYGGQRLHGRTTAELAWQLPEERSKVALVAVLLAYEGTRIEAALGHPQFAVVGERRWSHQLLLASGISF